MARCKALKKDGTRCRNEALEGSDFCRVHQGYDGPIAEEEEVLTVEAATAVEEQAVTVEDGTAEEGPVLVKTEYQKFRIRYIGNTSYWFAGYHFDTHRRELEVPRDVRDFLLEHEPELFEEA